MSTRILLVEDEPDMVLGLKDNFEFEGYEVLTASDGAAGLERARALKPDLVVLDIMLPKLSGLEVCKALRGEGFDKPIIMLTARGQEIDKVVGLELGADDYVTKPLDFPVVLARLETQLAVKQQKEQIARLATDLELRNRFIQNTFGRYLSEDVVKSLLESPEGLKLGGERRKVTILMSDLRGFTSLSESLGPEEVVRTLNGYLGAMAEVILQHKGTIDEFIGDAILAIFGAPVGRQDDAKRAIACAVEMQLAMHAVNEYNRRNDLPEIEMGIALHTGEVIVGNIGSEQRAKYGVVGAPVNHAGRIESFTVGGQILVSEATLEQAGDGVAVGERFSIDAKGAREPLVVFDLLGVAGEGAVSLPTRAEAFVALAAELPLTYSVMAGKTVGAETFTGGFVEISASGGVLRSPRRLRALSDLKMTLKPAGRPEAPELYAKVVGTRGTQGELFRVRFTSVPSEVEALLRSLLGEPAKG